MQDFFKGRLFSFFRVRSSSLERVIKGLKRREKFEAENFSRFAKQHYTYLRY